LVDAEHGTSSVAPATHTAHGWQADTEVWSDPDEKVSAEQKAGVVELTAQNPPAGQGMRGSDGLGQ
jgi:hypothetical protein